MSEGSAGSSIATITLDRPDRLNCQSPTMWNELVRVRGALPGTVRIVVIRAEGRAFSAGLDKSLFSGESPDGIRALPRLPHDEATGRIAGWQRAFDWSSRPDVVSIATVQGHAIGGGFQLALGCDIRILADDAQFCMAEPKLGIVPDLGGTKRLVDLVGVSRASEICLTARRVDAAEALRIGLASHVVARDDLDAAVERTVAALAAVDRDAAAETKALLHGAVGRTQDEQQAAERDAQYRRLRALAGLDAED
ncbi:MAG TPA: enoyl-CoA hydratase/isomerase family protein [Jatrophihabitans sp.]|uniref:enoyl-CoA hydratase/isomerase family protein n=1 Tax=Jatrophihabitans sp. TaxID=1932789 RepID=UPI002DFEA1DE|nr:enoyl-CoA hydratase/isomerase family protein [Jatrophihabitans sp.]